MSTDRDRRGRNPRAATARSAAGARQRRRAANDGLLIVGLVGQAGSGKSTVARALAERGAAVIEADRIGHEVTDRDPEVRAALITEYGRDVYLEDGALDRGRVARRVFSDSVARARLDALVHPRIVSRIRGRIEELRAGGFRGVVVVDAALMLQWGFHRECDVVLMVSAPLPRQLERLQAGRGWSPSEAKARIAAQPPPDEYESVADERIDNGGSLEDLAGRIAAVWERLAMRLDRRP